MLVLIGLIGTGPASLPSAAATTSVFRQKAFDLMTSPEAKRAFDIAAEPEVLRRIEGAVLAVLLTTMIAVAATVRSCS